LPEGHGNDTGDGPLYEKFDQPPYDAALMNRLGALPGVESAGFARYFGTINTQLSPQPIGFAGADTTTNGVMEYVSPAFFGDRRHPDRSRS
jgi:hypothetical protein